LIIKEWNFSEYAFPAYLIIICTTIVVFIWRGNWYHATNSKEQDE